MADATSVAKEAIENPAEVKEVEVPGKVEADEQTGTHGAAGLAKAEVVDNDKSKEKGNKSASDQDVNMEESPSKSDRKGANGSTKKDYANNKYSRNDRNGDRYERRDNRFNDRNDRKRQTINEDYDNLPVTDDPVAIRDQVEFYFSDRNLNTDEHMFIEMDAHRNKPISLKHLTTFKRMRRFQPYSAIVTALRESESLVLVDDGLYSGKGNEGVKRKDPIVIAGVDEDGDLDMEDLIRRFRKQSGNSLEASIYATGFGDKEKAGQIAIESFFKPYGSVVVRKRRYENDEWKGSVFVEFDTVESQQQFLALDPKPKFNGNELSVKAKKQYNEDKCKELGIEPGTHNKDSSRPRFRDHRASGRGRRGDRYNGRSDRRGGRNDRSDDRRDRRDRRDDRRDHRRDRHRDRSGSPDSNDSRDWNGRRDKFQKSRDYKDDRRGSKHHSEKKPEKFELPRDENGVPIVQDSRVEKRKADDERLESPKKAKIEIKEDA